VAEDEHHGDPLDLLLRGSRELMHPEELLAEATRDIVKEELRKHLERKLKENPELAKELKDAVRDLLEARALEYAALLRVTAATARLGFAAAPDSVKGVLARDVASLLSRELGSLVDKI
jgi:hypothetical protein